MCLGRTTRLFSKCILVVLIRDIDGDLVLLGLKVLFFGVLEDLGEYAMITGQDTADD